MNKNWRIILTAALAMSCGVIFPRSVFSFHVGLGNAVAAEGSNVVNKAAAASSLPSCGGNFQPFTQAPITDPTYVNLTPLGSQSSHILPPDHMYPNYTTGSSGQALYAPSAGWVVQVDISSYTTGLPANYSIVFAPCAEVEMYFQGLPAINAALEAAANASPNTSCSPFNNGGQEQGTGCTATLQYAVSTGTILATGQMVDFGPLEDSRIQLTGFANPLRHNLNRGFCPLSYWQAGSLPTSQYTTGDYVNGVTVARSTTPACGTIVQDIPGTAQGDWYVPGAPESQDASYADENDELALVHDSVFWSSAVFSVGTQNSLSPEFPGGFTSNNKAYFMPKTNPDGSFKADPSNIDIDFSLVTPNNNIYCYDTLNTFNPEFSPSYLPNTIVLLQMVDADDLKIEAQNPGTNCTGVELAGSTWAFTSAAVAFQR